MNVTLAIPSFRLIGSFELPLLTTVAELGVDAYGKSLAHELSRRLKRNVTVGQVSRSLNNLQDLGIVESRSYLPKDRVKGQRSRLVFSLTEKGRKLLRKVDESSNAYANGDPPRVNQGVLVPQ